MQFREVTTLHLISLYAWCCAMSHLICYHITFIYLEHLRNFLWIDYISTLTTPIKLKTIEVGTITYENPCQPSIWPLNKSRKFLLIKHMTMWDSFDSRVACNHVIYVSLHLIEWKGFSRSWLVKQTPYQKKLLIELQS